MQELLENLLERDTDIRPDAKEALCFEFIQSKFKKVFNYAYLESELKPFSRGSIDNELLQGDKKTQLPDNPNSYYTTDKSKHLDEDREAKMYETVQKQTNVLDKNYKLPKKEKNFVFSQSSYFQMDNKKLTELNNSQAHSNKTMKNGKH